jgi:hypothetical protein
MRDAVHMEQLHYPIDPTLVRLDDALLEGAAMIIDKRKTATMLETEGQVSLQQSNAQDSLGSRHGLRRGSRSRGRAGSQARQGSQVGSRANGAG